MTPTEAVKLALGAWGIAIIEDGRLTTNDGRILKVKWDRENHDRIAKELEQLHIANKLDGELEVSAIFLESVLKAMCEKSDCRATE